MFIGKRAFAELGLYSVSIPNSVISIGEEAFANNYLISIIGGNSVISIGAGAFKNAFEHWIPLTIPDSVTSIGEEAFQQNLLDNITIGANVAIEAHTFPDDFYNKNDMKAGIYKYTLLGWKYNPLPSFPSQLIGTWKRDKFDNTLTFTTNTVKASNQLSAWNLTDVSGNGYTITDTTNWVKLFSRRTDNLQKITIKTDKGGALIISGDKRKGDDNWNGTWKKQ